MRPDYPFKIFYDRRDIYVLLVQTLAAHGVGHSYPSSTRERIIS